MRSGPARWLWLGVALTWGCAGPDVGADARVEHDASLDAGEDAREDAGPPPPSLDERIEAALADEEVPVRALEPEEPPPAALVALGEALFYDPVLSGNRDVACASCHQGALGTSDGLPLNLGTGATGLGEERALGGHPPWGRRHTPDLWNRGRMDVLFWDGRVAREGGGVRADVPVPDGLADPLAVQALHPILDPLEMRGQPGDVAVDGSANELAGLPAEQVYERLEQRLAALDGYRALWLDAFGHTTVRIADVARALAAFQRVRYAATDTPWDRYLRGDADALTTAQKLGAVIFFGDRGCSNCHAGPLLSDQRFHDIGVPLLSPVDEGRAGRTGMDADRYAFRTPPLRNVAAAPPFMHNGTLETLDDAVAHYGRPLETAREVGGEHLPDDLRARLITEGPEVDALLSGLSPDLPVEDIGSIRTGLSNLRAFLLALVDEAALARATEVPDAVPSGLRVGGGGPPE